eukprot:TRINITY_DN2332_c0_g2_i1.p2 TRINITY_DN2332_c0_g2~~TRINITY_DN2332_c0_g2_i1.p2  ORF type:complete len:297 (+),score=106.30 TRINITY_DN2332_c0_g2_i1:55-945(+)
MSDEEFVPNDTDDVPTLTDFLQSKFEALTGATSGYLSDKLQNDQVFANRIYQLNQLDQDIMNIYESYAIALNVFKEKYFEKAKALIDQRNAIICGNDSEKILADLDGNKGIPNFWLEVLQTLDLPINEFDEEVLEHLTKVNSVPFNQDDANGMILTLEFDENPYFDNQIINKIVYIAPGFGDNLEGTESATIAWKDVTFKDKISFFKLFEEHPAMENPEKFENNPEMMNEAFMKVKQDFDWMTKISDACITAFTDYMGDDIVLLLGGESTLPKVDIDLKEEDIERAFPTQQQCQQQ